MQAVTTSLADIVLENPDWLEQEASERSLLEFVRQYWQYIDPAPFMENWHLGLMCEYLEAVEAGEIKRLLILVPPRTSKSSIVSVMFPAWYWTRDPSMSFLSASYAQSLSIRDSMRCRRVVQSPLYTSRYSDMLWLTSDQNTKGRFDNNHQGYRLATSVDAAVTGEGANVIIIDDPLNVTDANSAVKRESLIRWFDESMTTRLNDPQEGAFVAVMQRVHEGDFAGHVAPSGDWEVLCLPMRYEADHPYAFPDDPRCNAGDLLWPERFPEDEVKANEIRMGSYATAGQYQQRPAPRKGGMFDPSWWQVVDAAPSGGVEGWGWDLAASAKGDYTVGIYMRLLDGIYYIMDVVRVRGTDLDAERAILNAASRTGRNIVQDIPQDPGQAGIKQRTYFAQKLAGYNVRFSPETGSKEVRAQAVSAQSEAGNVKLVRGHWNQPFIEECGMFPNGDFDDQVDAMSRIFHRLTSGIRPRRIAAPIAIETR